MRRLFRLLLLALVLLLVAMFSAMTAMRYAIHGREVEVPDLTGLTRAEADEALLDLGLILVPDSRFYSAQVPEGRIISQHPPAHTTVRRGWRLRVAESMGPQRASIPSVTGQSRRAAELNLLRRGLEVGSTATLRLPRSPAGVPSTTAGTAGQVLAQTPAPNAEGVLSPRVSLLFIEPEDAAPGFLMPILIGRRLGEVREEISAAGLTLARVSVWVNQSVDAASQNTPSDPPAASATEARPADTRSAEARSRPPHAGAIIVRQSPPAGQRVDPSIPITLEVTQ